VLNTSVTTLLTPNFWLVVYTVCQNIKVSPSDTIIEPWDYHSIKANQSKSRKIKCQTLETDVLKCSCHIQSRFSHFILYSLSLQQMKTYHKSGSAVWPEAKALNCCQVSAVSSYPTASFPSKNTTETGFTCQRMWDTY